MRKLGYTYPQWIIIQPYKKKEILLLATTWMDLDGIILSEIEVSQTEKDKQVYDIACTGNEKTENTQC